MKTSRLPPPIALVLLGLNLLVTVGCFWAAVGASETAGAGTLAATNGDLKASVVQDVDGAAAANQAMIPLDFTKINEKKDAAPAAIVARNTMDDRMKTELSRADN